MKTCFDNKTVSEQLKEDEDYGYKHGCNRKFSFFPSSAQRRENDFQRVKNP